MLLTSMLHTCRLAEDALLVVNTLSGAVDVMKGAHCRAFEAFRKEGVPPTDPEFVELLRRRGYLYVDAASESEAWAALVRHFTVGAAATRFYFCLTFDCDMRCRYCNEWDLRGDQRSMSVADCAAAFASMRAVLLRLPEQTASRTALHLYGGEPLLPANADAVEYTCEQAQEMGLSVCVITNGVHIAEHLDLFQRYRCAVRSFVVTIDGPPPVHDWRRPLRNGGGTFHIVAAGVDALLAAGYRVRVQANIDHQNVGNIPELATLVRERGWTEYPQFESCIGKVMFPAGNLVPGYDHVMSDPDFVYEVEKVYLLHPEAACVDRSVGEMLGYNLIRRATESSTPPPRLTGCDAVRGTVYGYAPDGLVYNCVETLGHADYAVGRYVPEFELYESELTRWRARNPSRVQQCRACRYLPLCGGPCALAWLASGRQESSPLCRRIGEVIDRFAEANCERLLSL